jgi:peptide/nickel transport system permease protein
VTAVTESPVVVPEAVDDAPDEGAEPRDGLGIGAWLSIAWLTLMIGAAALANVLPIHDPNEEVASLPKLAPGQEGLLLGADRNSRDILARIIWGGRNSLTIAVCAVLMGFVIGGLLGLVGGYFRNWIGNVLTSLFDILLAIPGLVLALSLVAVLKGDPSVSSGFHLPTSIILILSLGIVSIPLLARITRANTLSWSQREFVTAARAQGATHRRILFREILPNVLPAMVYIALLGIAIAIVAEGGLAILGASMDPPTATWGTMINDGRSNMEDAPFIMFTPIVFVFFTVMSLNYLGDVVRDRFDVRESAL